METFLHYEERGTGAPLILLHGNGEDGSYFVHQMNDLSRDYRVIAVDTRGHGRSPRGTAPFTLGQFVQDLADFLKAMELERVHLLGFSDGGNIALLFALRYPERVEKLILNGANLKPWGVKPLVQLPICLGYGLTSLLSLVDEGARAKKELLGLMVREPHIPLSMLRRLRVPTLVIAGDRDMIREAHTRAIAGAIPGAKLEILPGGHFIANQNSAAFNAAVEAFLKE